MQNIEVRSSGLEKYRVPLVSRLDPTGVLPAFQFTATGATDPGVTWVSGEWEGGDTYDEATKRVNALTPTIGRTGAGLEITEGATLLLWVKWEHDGEEIIRPVATMEAV